jgi:DNA-binding response OmpR family regulator
MGIMDSRSDGGSNHPGPVEILVVEGSAAQAEQLRIILEEAGYMVSVASNGVAAFELLNERRPAITLSTVNLPEINGYELCRLIKATPELRDMPVILLTSRYEPHQIIKGLECGADNFVLKPYASDFILSRIRYVLQNQERRDRAITELGLEVTLGDKKHFITSDRLQIIELLFSTFEAALQRSRDLERAQKELRHARDRRIVSLERITLMCAQCRKIRHGGDWEQIEVFVEAECDTEFSHTLCPDCLHSRHPEFPTREAQKGTVSDA